MKNSTKRLVKLSELDESLFKARDLPLVFAIEKFLAENNMEAYVGGSVVNGAPRQYGDIDLFVPRYNRSREGFSKVLGILSSLNVKNVFDARLMELAKGVIYMGGPIISNRYFLVNKKTMIDLCFEAGLERNASEPSQN